MQKRRQNTDRSGIEMTAPRISGKRSSVLSEILLGVLLTLLGVFGAQWCFISTFSLPVLPLPIVLFTLLFVLGLNGIYRLKRARFIILPLLTLIYAWIGYRLHTEFIQGFLITTNQMMTVYAAHSSYVLPIYQVTAKAGQYSQFVTTFVLYVSFFLCLFLSWAIVRRQSFAAVFLTTVPFLAAGLPFYIIPDDRAVLLLFICWTTLLFLRIPSANTPGIFKTRGGYRAASPAQAAKAGLQLLPAVLLSLAVILCAFPKQTYQYSPSAQEARSRLTEAMSRLSLMPDGDTLAGNSDRVNLNSTDSIRFTGKTMLQVQATTPHAAYLKGFTGSVFTGKSWERLPDSDYQDVESQLGNLHVQNMSSKYLSLVQLPEIIDFGGYGIHVKNVSENKRLIYTPYNLTTTPEQITGVKFLHDGDIRSNWIFGTSEYTLYANSFNEGRISSTVSGTVSALYQAAVKLDGVDRTKLKEEILPYMSNYNDANSLKPPEGMRVFYTGVNPIGVPESFDPERKSFLTGEHAYRTFLYDKYTQLPENVAKAIKSWMDDQGFFSSLYWSQGYKKLLNSQYYMNTLDRVVAEVKQYLANHYTYTLSPGKVPDGKDFTQYFLEENKKGYCVHFATAGVVMLRAAGVPARYAEGYIVTKDDYRNAADGCANIPDSRAHAWAEVYYPGLGWQPVEMTPGFRVEDNQAQGASAPGIVSSTPAESKLESSTSSAPESKPESKAPRASSAPSSLPRSGVSADPGAAVLPVILTILLLIFVVVCAAVIRRSVARRLRQKRFAYADPNQSALEIYRYLQKLARFHGEVSQTATELAEKARFSQHKLTLEEIDTLRQEAERLAAKNLQSASSVQRILLKYWYGLL